MSARTEQLAAQGRNGDTLLAHLTPGEIVVPASVQPALRGLLSQAFARQGLDAQRYTAGQHASRNPKTGLLEFFDGDGEGEGADGGLGAGKAAAAAADVGGDAARSMSNVNGERGWSGGGSGGGGDVGQAMMDQNAAPLGYGYYTGETVPGTLAAMAQNMRQANYRNAAISDTMSNMGVGFGQRFGALGLGALGSFGESALNRVGSLVGGLALGPVGAPIGGLLGTAVVGEPGEIGPQLARNVVGLLGSQFGGALGGPLGATAGSMVAQRAYGQASSTPSVATQDEHRSDESNGGVPTPRAIAANIPDPVAYTAQVQPQWHWNGAYFTQG